MRRLVFGGAGTLAGLTTIACFHFALGVRSGVPEAAGRLRSAGRDVRVIDQYQGQVFDDNAEASAFAASIGYLALMQRAAESVADLPDGFVVAGL